MKHLFLLLLSLLLLSCGTPEPRNSDIAVEYYGKVESESSKIYLSEDELRSLIKKTGPHNIVFTRSHCPPCNTLMINLKEKGLMNKVVFVNGDKDWVKAVAAMMGIRSTPTMVVVEKGEKEYRYEGVAEIVMYLIRH
tara:strand:- start:2200 stop:2610 length:411 start_codon:yes stop_codon:yes gene_type:complete